MHPQQQPPQPEIEKQPHPFVGKRMRLCQNVCADCPAVGGVKGSRGLRATYRAFNPELSYNPPTADLRPLSLMSWSGLLHQYLGGFAPLTLDVEAILGIVNAHSIELVVLDGSIAAVGHDTLNT